MKYTIVYKDGNTLPLKGSEDSLLNADSEFAIFTGKVKVLVPKENIKAILIEQDEVGPVEAEETKDVD